MTYFNVLGLGLNVQYFVIRSYMYIVHDRLNPVHVSPDFHLRILPSDLHSFLKN